MLINNENIDEQALPNMLENFSGLREKALAYIQQISSANWTDHNVHDPGITIMEAICYALSDVGFRMNFPMQDLLVDESGNLSKDSFYYAQDILPCHPVTINDFRKILIDLPLIKNAWITPVLSPNDGIALDYEPMFIYKEGGKLLLKKDVDDLPIPAAKKNELLSSSPVFIIGLYAINIEFETQPILGSIDSGEAFEGVYEKDFFGDIFYDIKNWNDLINDKNTLQKIANTYAANSSDITLNILNSTKNKYNNSDGKLDERVLKEWYYDIEVLCKGVLTFTFKEVLFQPFLETKKGIAGKDLKNLITKNSFAFFNTCFAKIQALTAAYTDIQKTLQQNRNLCEDYLPQISAIPTIDFRICADIDVDSKIDIEQVQASIFYAIEEYISPTIPFYTFNELVAKGMAIEEILEGPKLSHGFILEEEMGENSFRNYSINLSDIINAIYETEGLINCRNVSLFLIDDNGDTIANSNKWVIQVPAGYKPILNKRKSKLTFYKNDLPLIANFKESIVKLSFLKTSRVKYSNSDVPQPVLNPTYRDLALHYSLANEFPATYKIGKNFPDEYVAKQELFASKQLEGYLLMFEQLIANFLKDLHQLKETLSWQTIQHVEHTSDGHNWRREYLLNTNPDSQWQNVIESETAFVKKRNASLDYLLSRFAENLQEVDNYFYLSTDNLKITEIEYYNYLIDLKQRFLSNYISISANRGAAINLYAGNSYFTTAISEYENRLSRLLGCELVKNNARKKVADIDITNITERGYFHVLEHLLLRIPKLSDEIIIQLKANGINTELLSICTDDDCTACGGFDPYSFTASVVLPTWLPVFADVHYRDFIEKLIRKETPTGVLLRICWIDEPSMIKYETAIENWWAARFALFNSDADTYNDLLIDYIKKQNEFVIVLKSQRSEYFPATLHGCEDEGEENNTRVFLDKTFLG